VKTLLQENIDLKEFANSIVLEFALSWHIKKLNMIKLVKLVENFIKLDTIKKIAFIALKHV
jgi:hypothetical protein